MKRAILLMVIALSGSTTADMFYLEDGGHHLINDGAYASSDVYLDYSSARNPGTHLELVDGGSILSLAALNNSAVTMDGGSIGMDLSALGSSTVTVSGGSINSNLEAFHNSTIEWRGGSFGAKLWVYNSATVYLYGSDFIANGQNISYGESLRDYGIFAGTITGTLQDGTAISHSFDIQLHTDADIVVVPLPPAVILGGIGLASAGLIGRRRYF